MVHFAPEGFFSSLLTSIQHECATRQELLAIQRPREFTLKYARSELYVERVLATNADIMNCTLCTAIIESAAVAALRVQKKEKFTSASRYRTKYTKKEKKMCVVKRV